MCSCCTRCIAGDNLHCRASDRTFLCARDSAISKAALEIIKQVSLTALRLAFQENIEGLSCPCYDVQECLKERPLLMPLLQSEKRRINSEGRCAV